ncbi:DUF262 domain-containing protein [Devosia albogilva]|uniref:DUF262 domain-containing protein n=1 Tax=Devosia albogilva TaxID=429726 RepID=A0ABW5QL52_9HYPH
MRVDQSSTDILSLVEKIRDGRLDIQPDFQRGQVWPEPKKVRLIDSILREWYVPAIHIVVNDDLDSEEVLDGQQRLQAVLSFMADEFAIDGRIEPTDDRISALHGMKYSQLPDRVRARFNRFPISIIRLRDYTSEEPGELFFRLNQLTALTAAEQRNALVGAPRNQVRFVVDHFEHDLGSRSIGFSNARMNFDDAISRLAVVLEHGSLSAKVTASSLERRYRHGKPFPDEIMRSISQALHAIASLASEGKVAARLNKASLFSWLYFYVDTYSPNAHFLPDFSSYYLIFENMRSGSRKSIDDQQDLLLSSLPTSQRGAFNESLSIFNDRASSRVNDVTSVLLRDLCLNCGIAILYPGTVDWQIYERRSTIRDSIERLGNLPSDVGERAMEEALLAKRWELAVETR